ncbi:hypothetical protein [Rubritalea tangerina]|uniref:hypothetical protein n=1 Tax=Rubritalea tangerina TaxID=430798 RepID=UPI0036097147
MPPAEPLLRKRNEPTVMTHRQTPQALPQASIYRSGVPPLPRDHFQFMNVCGFINKACGCFAICAFHFK